MAPQIKTSLPSSDAAKHVLEGKPGAWLEFGASTVLRGVLVMPGLLIAGVDAKKALLGSMISSVLISTFVIGYLKFNSPGAQTARVTAANSRRALAGARRRQQALRANYQRRLSGRS